MSPSGVGSGDKAQARGCHGGGLARHRLGEALTLESGGQVHLAAGEEAGQNFIVISIRLLRRVAFA